jgi:hypothetical protein
MALKGKMSRDLNFYVKNSYHDLLDRRNRRRHFFKVVFWTFAVICVIGGIGICGESCSTGCNPDYSEGERTGIVWKFSEKGNFKKSWEGELNMNPGGVMALDAQGHPVVWEFSVEDHDVVQKINEAQRARKTVTLHLSLIHI